MPDHEHVEDVVEPPGDEYTEQAEPTLPEAVRQRVIALAAAAITGLAADEVPVALRRVAKFAPNIPIGRGGTADEVAEAVLWLLSDKASYVTGTLFNVSGGR